VKRPRDVIVGPNVRRQTTLRPPKAVRDLDEFLDFLERLEAVFGRIERPRRITRGRHFLL
jgi:hypothetical protein